jgi:serine/threonine protein kinase
METFGRYRLDSELGRGAVGVVYRGFDPRMSRHVAVKLIRLDQSTTANEKSEITVRFGREAAAAGGLSHANIVTVYDSGEQADLQYLVLKQVDGGSLEKTLSNGQPLDRKTAVSVRRLLRQR